MTRKIFSFLGWIELILLLGIFLLIGCQLPTLGSSGPALATLSQDCQTKGTLQRLSMDSPTRGYAYDYELYLPPCFDPASGAEARYPVLYLVPGRGSGPGAWFAAGAANVADEMILKGEIAPFIIVATENIDGDMYATAIMNDVIPTIEKEYPVHPSRKYHAVAGGSLGGIAAYRIVFRSPEKFSSAAMFGSGVIHGEEEIVKGWLDAISTENSLRVFMDTGTGDPLMLERAQVMASILYEKKVAHILHIGDGAHTYSYWVSNFRQYLTWLAEDWK